MNDNKIPLAGSNDNQTPEQLIAPPDGIDVLNLPPNPPSTDTNTDVEMDPLMRASTGSTPKRPNKKKAD